MWPAGWLCLRRKSIKCFSESFTDSKGRWGALLGGQYGDHSDGLEKKDSRCLGVWRWAEVNVEKLW